MSTLYFLHDGSDITDHIRYHVCKSIPKKKIKEKISISRISLGHAMVLNLKIDLDLTAARQNIDGTKNNHPSSRPYIRFMIYAEHFFLKHIPSTTLWKATNKEEL